MKVLSHFKLFDLLLMLNKHQKLRSKRDPMWSTNKATKIFIWLSMLVFLGEFILIGTLLGFGFSSHTALEPYYMMNRGIFIMLLLDWKIRFIFQQLPVQQIKPYTVLPLKRTNLIDVLLLRNGYAGFNWLFLSYMIPFALIAVTPNWGLMGVTRYILGLSLLFIANSYWYLLCRTLIKEHIAWVALPIAIYGGIAALEFIPDGHIMSYATMYFGQGLIAGWTWAYLIPIALIVILYSINRVLSLHLSLRESGHGDVKEEKVVPVSEISHLNRLGNIGFWMQLELKLLRRNKALKVATNMLGIMIMVFVALMFFVEDVYKSDEYFSWWMYSYFLGCGGFVMLANVLSYEGNYIDGLMTKRESVYDMLTSKYYLSAVFAILPMLLMMVLVYKGRFDFFQLIAIAIYFSGILNMGFIQNAMFNKNTLPLNKTVNSGARGRMTLWQMMITFGTMIITSLIAFLGYNYFPHWATSLVLAALGLLALSTARIWLKWTYQGFMKNKYKNLEGFRASREEIV